MSAAPDTARCAVTPGVRDTMRERGQSTRDSRSDRHGSPSYPSSSVKGGVDDGRTRSRWKKCEKGDDVGEEEEEGLRGQKLVKGMAYYL